MRAYMKLWLVLCQGVRTDKIGFDINMITMVISSGLALGYA